MKKGLRTGIKFKVNIDEELSDINFEILSKVKSDKISNINIKKKNIKDISTNTLF
jgi:hypothetical protein